MKAKRKAGTKDHLIYLGFNGQVVALDRQTGILKWSWRTKKVKGFVAILVDGKRLFASIGGYTYCLNAHTGEQLWFNPLTGFGVGIPCLASSHGYSTLPGAGAAQAQQNAAMATAAAVHATPIAT